MDVLLVDSGLKVLALAFFVATTGGWAGCRGISSPSPDGSADEGVPELPAQCGRTEDRANIVVQLAGGTDMSCGSPRFDGGVLDGGSVDGAGEQLGAGTTTTFTGTITGGDASSLVIDTCDPNQGCASGSDGSARIEITAPGLDLSGIPRIKVEVRWQTRSFHGCHQTIEITSVDPAADPASGSPTGPLLLAVADGGDPLPDSPYQVERVPLGCYSDRGCGGPAPDDYAFDFAVSDMGAEKLRVYMGQTVPWEASGKSYEVRNLRSFQSNACDDYWNFAYYIVTAS